MTEIILDDTVVNKVPDYDEDGVGYLDAICEQVMEEEEMSHAAARPSSC